MSTIGVIHHNENIRNIIKKPKDPIIKSPRYKSKHSGKHNKEHIARDPKICAVENQNKSLCLGSKGRPKGHDTFGYAHYELDPPWDYLKKGRKVVYPPDVGK